MKLSQEAIDDLLHIIENFDRERGVPHNYMDLEAMLKSIKAKVVEEDGDFSIYIVSPKKSPV
jgi:hypothetical protein